MKTRVPKEENFTQEELIQKVNKLKRKFERFSLSGYKKKSVAGKELFLDTEAGSVRVLAYRMENPGKLPLFVNIHGGGFVLGDPEMDDPYLMNVALNANVKILSIDYSLAPEAMFPQALNDCYAVIKYAQNNHEEFGIDPQRIAVGGHSAGGNLSAACALKNAETQELDIKCLILDYPPLDVYTDPYLKPKGKGLLALIFMPPKICRLFDACYCNDKERRKNPLISPVYAETEQLKHFPPTLLYSQGNRLRIRQTEVER
jgi:acetyl esterase